MTSPFIFSGDPVGGKTLEVISGAGKFNQWMYETIRPWCYGKILEAGSGIGNISEYFIRNGADITLTDFQQEYVDLLKEKYFPATDAAPLFLLDLARENFNDVYLPYQESYDSVFALNVIEHIQDDRQAVRNCNFLLKPGGRLIVLVPAYRFLYNRFDKNLGHYRRYTRKSLQKIFLDNGFMIEHRQYFNLAGIAGWFLSGSILKKATIPSGQMKLYNRLVPFFRLIDQLIFNRAGLSVVVTGKKLNGFST